MRRRKPGGAPMSSNQQIVQQAFYAWSRGDAHVSSIFDPDMTWEIVGRSAAARCTGR